METTTKNHVSSLGDYFSVGMGFEMKFFVNKVRISVCFNSLSSEISSGRTAKFLNFDREK